MKDKGICPVEAYKILLQRNINEDRLLTERTTIFLTASSILFLGFIMLLNPSLAPVFKWFRIILSLGGCFFTLLLYSFNRATHNRLEFLWGVQEKIERDTPEFGYMRDQGIMPQIEGQQFGCGEKR